MREASLKLGTAQFKVPTPHAPHSITTKRPKHGDFCNFKPKRRTTLNWQRKTATFRACDGHNNEDFAGIGTIIQRSPFYIG